MGNKSEIYAITDVSHSTDSSGTSYDTSTSLIRENFRFGDDRPNFAQVIADGGNATNWLHGVLYNVKIQPGFVKGVCTQCGPGAQEQISTFCGLGINWVDNDDNSFPADLQLESQAIARQRAWTKLSELQSGSFNGYAFLGEFSETVKLLKNPLKESIKLTRDLLSVRGKASIKDFGDLWLQYRFGILPLLSDINEINQIIQQKAEERIRERYRFYGKASRSDTTQYQNGSPGFIAAGYGFTDKIYDAETIIRLGIQTSLLDGSSDSYSRALQTLDISKVLPGAWELVSWSFLIDYFVNVGSIISASSTSSTVLSWSSESNVSTITHRTTVTDWISTWPEGFEIIASQPKTVTIKRREVIRQGGTLEIPPLTFTLPGSDIRLKNIAALLTKFL